MEFEDITYFLTKLAKIAVHWFYVICVRFMYKYLALCKFLNPTPFVFFKDISCLKYILTDLKGQQGHYATFSRIMRFRPPTTRPLCIMGVSRNVAPLKDGILRKTSFIR